MNKQEILEKAKNHTLKSKKVFISDWDCEVVIRQLSAKQYTDISGLCLDESQTKIDQTKFINMTIIKTTFDNNGEQIFDNDDMEIILGMSADGYSNLILAVNELNNLDGSNTGSRNLKNSSKMK